MREVAVIDLLTRLAQGEPPPPCGPRSVSCTPVLESLALPQFADEYPSSTRRAGKEPAGVGGCAGGNRCTDCKFKQQRPSTEQMCSGRDAGRVRDLVAP